jgi:hypothetical protein
MRPAANRSRRLHYFSTTRADLDALERTRGAWTLDLNFRCDSSCDHNLRTV